MDIFDAAGVIQDGEALLRLVHAEALHVTGDHERGRVAMAEAHAWLRAQPRRSGIRACGRVSSAVWPNTGA